MNAEICRHLRNKVMYVPGREATNFADESESPAASYCWCNKTMTEIGTDNRLVSPEGCSSPERTCYQPR